MSVAYALAWIILSGKLTLDEFTADALRDPGVRALMGKIDLEVDPAAHGERQTRGGAASPRTAGAPPRASRPRAATGRTRSPTTTSTRSSSRSPEPRWALAPR